MNLKRIDAGAYRCVGARFENKSGCFAAEGKVGKNVELMIRKFP
jgi:hypothetical protein